MEKINEQKAISKIFGVPNESLNNSIKDKNIETKEKIIKKNYIDLTANNKNNHIDASSRINDHGVRGNLIKDENFGSFQEQIVDNLNTEGCIHEICYPPYCDLKKLRTELSAPLPPINPAKVFPFKLDAFQKRAINCVERKYHVLISAHTSSGKTTVAEYAIAKSLKNNARVIYTSPIKALSNQKYRDLYEEFQDVGLMTGDVTINPTASCIVMTTEILRSMLYRGSEVIREVEWVIFDEIHYMKDKSRGVVWEECLILLPKLIRFIFLSATIPNASEFACWISKLTNHPCNVVYTEKRPVPLQHYIYPEGAKGLYLSLDENMEFKEDNFVKAISGIEDKIPKKNKNRKRKRKTNQSESSDLFKLMKMIMVKNFEPVIVFSFSKRVVESNALLMSKLDFADHSEKKMIEQIFINGIASLSNDDKKLPQVNSILPLLKQGIGIHHSGLLPILKEIVEILFHEGLIKCLFATETFAMGLNMPAKTVVFTNIRKFDGSDYRHLSSGEYIQMSGRAGRRGIDKIGMTILCIHEKIEPLTVKKILKGYADPLNSSFHLGYNMLINLLRVEDINPSYMIEHSFYQFQSTRKAPSVYKKKRELEEEAMNLKIENENEMSKFYYLKIKKNELKRQMNEIRNLPEYILPFLNPGRLTKVIDNETDWGWGVIINFQKINLREKFGFDSKSFNSNKNEINKYIVDILLRCAKLKNNYESPKPPLNDNDEYTMEVVPCELKNIDELSSIRLYMKENLKLPSNRNKLGNSIKEVLKKYSNELPLIDPIENMKVKSSVFKKVVRKLESTSHAYLNHKIYKSPNLKENLKTFEKKLNLVKQIKKLNNSINEIETNENINKKLEKMKNVLKKLGHITKDNIVNLKGRVACDFSTGDELLSTELLLRGHFSDLSPEQIVALASCLVFTDRCENIIRLKAELAMPYSRLQKSVTYIAKCMVESNIEFDEEEYINSFRPNLMDVCFMWCKGFKFAEICKMTNIFEGTIIRTMRRLELLLEQFISACKIIGNEELKRKFEKGVELMKRDIIFAASLYL